MNKLLVRTISGACFVAITVGFFFLRLIKPALFDIYTAFLMVVGTYELSSKLFVKKPYKDGEEQSTSAFSEKLIFIITMLSSLLVAPAFNYKGYILALSVVLAELFVNAFIVLFAKLKAVDFLKVVLSAIYPKVLISAMLFANALTENSLLALVLIFVVAPATDTFAYLVGCSLKGPKLCPKISPNKTISGSVGGILGGVIASIIVYFIITPVTTLENGIVVLIFAIIGLFGSALTQIGDLTESYIKRRLGIKDMGNIMPGHGGVLDRIDGVMFNAVLVTILVAIL
jgi:phosphatidate cytidylyltransferase